MSGGRRKRENAVRNIIQGYDLHLERLLWMATVVCVLALAIMLAIAALGLKSGAATEVFIETPMMSTRFSIRPNAVPESSTESVGPLRRLSKPRSGK